MTDETPAALAENSRSPMLEERRKYSKKVKSHENASRFTNFEKSTLPEHTSATTIL